MEWQDEFDVNVYDFGARNYDPGLVKTFTPDPMAEKFYHLSPYSFLNNNPLSTIDPTGALSITLTGQDAQDFFQGLKDDIASRPREKEEWFDDVGDDPPGNGKNGGGKCPDGDCDDKKSTKNPLKTALPCVKCPRSRAIASRGFPNFYILTVLSLFFTIWVGI